MSDFRRSAPGGQSEREVRRSRREITEVEGMCRDQDLAEVSIETRETAVSPTRRLLLLAVAVDAKAKENWMSGEKRGDLLAIREGVGHDEGTWLRGLKWPIVFLIRALALAIELSEILCQ
jgi:hypothetical protein